MPNGGGKMRRAGCETVDVTHIVSKPGPGWQVVDPVVEPLKPYVRPLVLHLWTRMPRSWQHNFTVICGCRTPTSSAQKARSRLAASLPGIHCAADAIGLALSHSLLAQNGSGTLQPHHAAANLVATAEHI